MGQGARWAGSAFKGVGENALGMAPVAMTGVLCLALVDLFARGVGRGPWGVLAVGFLAAVAEALRLAVGLALWDRGGRARPWSVAWRASRHRLASVVAVGCILTLAWGLPTLLGAIATANGHPGVGTLLFIFGLGVLLYVAGRRYLAMPIALHEGASAWASLKASRIRLRGHRRSVVAAVFLIHTPFAALGILVASNLEAMPALAGWPTLQTIVPDVWMSLVVTFEAALLSRLAWQVHDDLRNPSPWPPPVSRVGQAIAGMRLAWLQRVSR